MEGYKSIKQRNKLLKQVTHTVGGHEIKSIKLGSNMISTIIQGEVIDSITGKLHHTSWCIDGRHMISTDRTESRVQEYDLDLTNIDLRAFTPKPE